MRYSRLIFNRINLEPFVSGGTSFEDKRKINYDKGQAELERRRRILEEAANREREERERKEREEMEKREKQRLIIYFSFFFNALFHEHERA